MTEASDTPVTEPFLVACHKCAARFDALAAEWCSHVAKERTFVCPGCGGCFCDAPASYKRNFWQQAPQVLWERRTAMQREKDAWINPAPAEVRRPLVLLVDDEKEVRAIASKVILELGYGLVIAKDGAEGLYQAAVYLPEIVLADAFMPKMDGREMCRRIKSTPATAKAGVVIMTSLYTKAQHKYEALKEFKADRFLTKPLAAEELKDVLRSLVP